MVALETLGQAFDSFERSALRVEGLATYVVEQEVEAFAAFLDGRDPDMSFLEPWLARVRNAVSNGRRHLRVRVLSEELTPYERFELNCGYPLTSDAGEEVRIIRRSPATGTSDHWVFDSRIAFAMIYDSDGRFDRPERVPETDAARVCALAWNLWNNAEPFKGQSLQI